MFSSVFPNPTFLTPMQPSLPFYAPLHPSHPLYRYPYPPFFSVVFTAHHCYHIHPLAIFMFSLCPTPKGARCSSMVRVFAHGAMGCQINPSFQPVLHDWCNKGVGMCYPDWRMMHIGEEKPMCWQLVYFLAIRVVCYHV